MGISRAGVTMVGGLGHGLDREDAARFAVLLATPVILAAGVRKLPSLAGDASAPFAIYCLIAGIASVIRFA